MIHDFSKYKFRSHALKNIMGDSRDSITSAQLKKLDELQNKLKRTDKQEEELLRLIVKRDSKEILSQTAKAYLTEVYIKEVFGREKDISSKYLEKGLYCEENGIDLLSEKYGTLFLKNKETREGEFIKGTPDIVTKAEIIDIKSSWDIFTFSKSAKTYKDYFWQMQAYMSLFDKQIAKVVFCLSDAPEHLIVSEKNKAMYLNGFLTGTDEYNNLENLIDLNMTFKDIDSTLRIKEYIIERSDFSISKIKEKVEASRIFLNNFKL